MECRRRGSADYQISELVSLIQSGDWAITKDRVVNLGLAPMVPFNSEPDPAVLEQLVSLEGGDLLVQGVELYAQECVACHGPDGLGTSLAPPLNDPLVREMTTDELRRTILNGVPGTLMASWDNSLSEDEITALLSLLTNWDQVPSGAIPLPDNPLPVTEESLALGSGLYTSSCARCHGPDGQGTQRAPALNVKGYLAETSDLALQKIVTQGVPGTSMPAWGNRLTEAEIQAIVGFVRSWEPNAPEVAEPARGGGPWWQSGSGTPSGGSRGGPPWMRNNSGSAQSGPELPSGGSSLPIDQGQTADLSASATDASEQSGPPVWAGQAESQAGKTVSHENAAPTAHQPGANGAASGHGQSVEITWWQELDRRIFAIVGIVLIMALILIGVAWVKLRQLTNQTGQA